MLLYQAVQAANATKHLLALSNSETLPQPAPLPSSLPAAAAAPVVHTSPYTPNTRASTLRQHICHLLVARGADCGVLNGQMQEAGLALSPVLGPPAEDLRSTLSRPCIMTAGSRALCPEA